VTDLQLQNVPPCRCRDKIGYTAIGEEPTAVVRTLYAAAEKRPGHGDKITIGEMVMRLTGRTSPRSTTWTCLPRFYGEDTPSVTGCTQRTTVNLLARVFDGHDSLAVFTKAYEGYFDKKVAPRVRDDTAATFRLLAPWTLCTSDCTCQCRVWSHCSGTWST
jgi:hypothetical protein